MTAPIPLNMIKAVLKTTSGNLKMAAESLGCSRQALHLRVNKSKELQQIIHDERQGVIDVAESALYNKVLDGDMRAIEFTLRTIGKDRGYVEKRQEEITGKDGGPLEHTHQINVPEEVKKVAHLLPDVKV